MNISKSSRARLYSSSSEKVSAFRERNKEAGLLRKEVLVTTETGQRLADIAKQQGTSVTNVASGLLEMGLAHYEALNALGTYASSSPTAPVSAPSAAVAATPAWSASASLGASLPTASAALAATVASSTSPRSALRTSDHDTAGEGELSLPNPITSFFERRKQRT